MAPLIAQKLIKIFFHNHLMAIFPDFHEFFFYSLIIPGSVCFPGCKTPCIYRFGSIKTVI